ncbi:MAG: hypothetical protein ACTSR3_21000 [Candidatus Helarchaeota archaeon]
MFYDIYILKKSGACLFHQQFYNVKENNLEVDLISGFFSAIILFTSQFINKKLEIMEIEYLRLIFREKNDYIFVAFVDENESISQVFEILDKIGNGFFEVYGEILNNWNFDREIFQGFDKIIEKIITKEDINRILLIEKIAKIINFGEKSDFEGILIFTNKAELMFSNIVDDRLSRFLIKLIENNEKIGFGFDQIIINKNNQIMRIDRISKSLISVILFKHDVSIKKIKSAGKLLINKLKTSILI